MKRRLAAEKSDDFKRRRGIFGLAEEFLDKPSPLIFEFMSNFLIVKAEYLFPESRIEYNAVSHLFEVLPEGVMAPYYDFRILSTSDSLTSIEPILRKGFLESFKEPSIKFVQSGERLPRRLDKANG